MNESFSKSASDISLSRQEHIDRQCDDFERAWRAGHHPKIEDYLKNLPDMEYSDMLRELIAVELERRHESGENPGMDEYVVRFPNQVESVQAAFDLMVRSAEGTDSTIDTTITEKAGQIIGHYKLLQKIGEGGFGVVYMAEQQEPVIRKVALKIIKPGMDTKEVIARFEAEEQALAMMDHPNIARVLDAGTTESGRPYFVMELVKGVPITEFCDRGRLSPQERLELFVSVCQAVQHAHQKGIIHRDIKPSNILITLHDGKPVVKVIDFGVAKAINQRLTERTLFTKFAQLIGTPMYMSPEQAEMSGLDVDTRTDIYSLGVVLYELLTGTLPFDKKRLCEAGYDEIRRIIREEDPPKPSTKISTLGDTASGICTSRNTEPKRLSALLRNDLDWIVMRAMEKDRRRRYETAKDFASDVLRFLHDQPVEASPPSTLYWIRKFVRRNKVKMGVVSVVTVLLISLPIGIGTVMIAKQKQHESDRKARDWEWLQTIALPELQKMKKHENWSAAFRLAEEARAKFPDDPTVQELWQSVSSTCTIVSSPSNANVYIRPYGSDGQFRHLGKTPLHHISLAHGIYHWKIDADGYESREGCAFDNVMKLKIALKPHKGKRSNMVFVEGAINDLGVYDQMDVTFFIDHCEVSNSQFKSFVDAHGYRERKYWHTKFLDGDKEHSFDESVARFVDSTGHPGPSLWKNGTYPPGEEDYPVRGISWYEAAAYAAFVGKSLPPVEYWKLASGTRIPDISPYILDASNINGAKPLPVDRGRGLGPFGTQDMFGNVCEWAWNEGAPGQRYVMSNAWDDPEYMYGSAIAHNAFERDSRIGFRCVLYESTPPGITDAIIPGLEKARAYPVSDQETETIFRLYEYTPKPLNQECAQVESTSIYQNELITLDAPSSNSKVLVHLYLPKYQQPPYQTIVFFPGLYARQRSKFPGLSELLLKLVQNGRAVCYPVYKGHYERRAEAERISRLQMMIEHSHELRATIDYLETRREIDINRLAYLGSSMGAGRGPIFLALETRFKTGILLDGGLWKDIPPESNAINFAPHVTIPVLMTNGDRDHIFPLEEAQLPLFQALATEQENKHHLVLKGGHGRGHNSEAIIKWLDRYLGVTGVD